MDDIGRRFAKLMAEHESRIAKLEQGGNTTQLNHSSIEDGRVNAYDGAGTLRQILGRQGDGTFAVSYANGPQPPQPSAPAAGGRELGIVVAWDGKCLDDSGGLIDPPADFQRVDVHVSEVDGFEPSSASLAGSMVAQGVISTFSDIDPKFVKLIAVSSSNVASAPSDQVSTQAFPASSIAVTDAIVMGPDGRFIAGDPDAARAQFGALGFRQFDEDGDLTVAIGSNPAAGNTLTVKGTPQEVRRNLCANPKLGNDLTGWESVRGTLTREDGANVGTGWCARVTGDGTDNPFVGFYTSGLAGKRVAVQAKVYSSVAASQIRLGYDGTDPQGGGFSAKALHEASFAAGETLILSAVLTVPDDMVDVNFNVIRQDAAVASPDFFDVSLCCIEESPVVRAYFDGDTEMTWPAGEITHGVWSDVPDNSMSSLVTPPTRLRTNLIPNPKLGNDASGWGGLRFATQGRVDGANVGTAWAFQGVMDGTQDNPAISGPGIAAVPLETYAIGKTVWSDVEVPVRIQFDWYGEGSGNYLKSTYGLTKTLPANATTVLGASFTAPASAVLAIPFVVVDTVSVPDGGILQASLAIGENTDRFDGYFDGDSPNADWTGTPGNSTSVLIDVEEFRDQTLASLSDEGSLTVQRLSTRELMVGGHDLRELTDLNAGKVLAHGSSHGDCPHTTSEIGWFEISYVAPAGRSARTDLSVGRVRTPGTTQHDGVLVLARYTTDGTAPTVSSPVLMQCEAGTRINAAVGTVLAAPAGSRVRILLTLNSYTGIEAYLEYGQMIATDVGPEVAEAHVLNDGGGGGVSAPPPAPTAQQYNTQWRALYGQTYNQHGFRSNGEAIQGFYPDGFNGDNKVMFGFDWRDIQRQTSGSRIDYIDVYLYFYHWYYNSGGTAVIGTHNDGDTGGGPYSVTNLGAAEYHIGKGAGKWCALPLWVGHGFRDDWIKGLNLDSAFKGHDLVYYGKANWDAVLSIWYTK